MITFSAGWLFVYNSIVLTCLLVTQIVLVVEIILATRRQNRERRHLAAEREALRESEIK